MTVIRWDGLGKLRVTKTPEGFLKGDVVVTRSGIFNYMEPDGKVRKELRHPDDVFDSESLDSLKMIPVVLDHPPKDANGSRMVTAENAKKLSVGSTGETHRVMGGKVSIPIVITDAAAVLAVESGKDQLSLGYAAEMDDETGVYNGEKFDSRQRGIKYNHLAIVDVARAGPEARIRMDSGATLIDETEVKEHTRMKIKFTIDGIEYEGDAELINALKKANTRADAAEGELKTKVSTLETNLAAEKTRADGLQSKLTDVLKDMPKTIKARVQLENKAAEILGKDAKLDAEDEVLMTSIIKKVMPEAKLDGVEPAYLRARFDSAVELHATMNDSAKRKQFGLPELRTDGSGAGDEVSIARKRYNDRLMGITETK